MIDVLLDNKCNNKAYFPCPLTKDYPNLKLHTFFYQEGSLGLETEPVVEKQVLISFETPDNTSIESTRRRSICFNCLAKLTGLCLPTTTIKHVNSNLNRISTTVALEPPLTALSHYKDINHYENKGMIVRTKNDKLKLKKIGK